MANRTDSIFTGETHFYRGMHLGQAIRGGNVSNYVISGYSGGYSGGYGGGAGMAADMAAAEKIIMAICLFSGFLWLRQRARGADLERQMGRSVLGVFVLLPAILIGEDYLFEHVRFGAYTGILLKVLMAGAAFPAIGLVFIRTGPAQTLQRRDDSGPV